MNNSIKFKRRLNHFLTYFYLVALSIIIIYPHDYVRFQDRECPCVQVGY